jgi:medium-chain acyl-[acyl-carrier-protein] hydrolase
MESPLLRVFCFPFAGGSAAVYGEWSRLLPPYVKVVPIEYPGHGRRFAQSPLAAVDQIAQVHAGELLADLDEGPYALFGHSMGAVVAFELARELRRRGAPLPVKIYASATLAPCSPEHEARGEDVSAMTDDEVRDRLIELGGTPQEILDNADLMELMLPIVRADMAACEDYVYRPETPLPCPITALGGVDDDTFEQSELTRWGEVTSKSFEVVTLPGGHFFLRTHTAALTRWLGEDIRKMLRIPL